MSVCQIGHSLAFFFAMLLAKNQRMSLAKCIMILKEHWENDKIAFQICEDIGKKRMREVLITYSVWDFFILWLPLQADSKHDITVRKII